MPRAANERTLMRAAALVHADLTEFVTRAARREAEAVIKSAERIEESERDFLRILELLDNPPPPNEKLRGRSPPCRAIDEPSGLARGADLEDARSQRVRLRRRRHECLPRPLCTPEP
ncbi:MAG: DUF1778 domain-containing protein [Mesorhizobium sp.]|nr:MAG: DUF1778 domain-containing protein [Mesorhizobium sp.]